MCLRLHGRGGSVMHGDSDLGSSLLRSLRTAALSS